MGQTASGLFAMADGLDSLVNDGDSPQLDSTILEARQKLLQAILNNQDCVSVLEGIIHMDCPNVMKYSILSVQELLLQNNQSLEQLKKIPVGLSILEKYGRHLMKPVDERNELWRYVKFSNSIFKERVEPLTGSTEILKDMGYTELTEDGLHFPSDKLPNPQKTLNITADIMLARLEMELFLNGIHPQPDDIKKFLTPQAIAEWQVELSEKQKTNPRNPPARNPGEQVADRLPLRVTVATPPPAQLGATSQLSTPVSASSLTNTFKTCDVCAEAATLHCPMCDNKNLCANCDEKWHKHPKRLTHVRTTVPPQPSPEVRSNNIDIQGEYGIKALPPKKPVFPPNTPRTAQSVISRGLTTTAVQSNSTVTVSTSAPNNLPNFECLDVKSTDSIQDSGQQMDLGHSNQIKSTDPSQIKSPDSAGQRPEIPDRRLKPQCGVPLTKTGTTVTQSQYGTTVPQSQYGTTIPQSQYGTTVPQSQYGTTVPQSQYGTFVPQSRYQSVYHPPELNSNVNSNIQYAQIPQLVSSAAAPAHTVTSELKKARPSSESYSSASVSHLKRSSDPMTSASGAADRQSPLHRRSNSAAAQSGFYTLPGRSAAASGSTTSKLLAKIMQIPDPEKRRSRCEINIVTLEDEMEDIEKELNTIIEEDENFHENVEFTSLNKKKGMLLRERKNLQRYLEEMDRMPTSNVPSSVPQEIFYPPSVMCSNIPVSPPGTRPQQFVPRSEPSALARTSEMLDKNSSQIIDPNSSVYSAVDYPPAASQAPAQAGGYNVQQPAGVVPAHLYPTLPAQNLLQQGQVAGAGQALQIPLDSTVPAVAEEQMLHTGQKQPAGATAAAKQTEKQNAVPQLSTGLPGFQKKWHCEHCTMINEPGTRVCKVCHKTSDKPAFIEEAAKSTAAAEKTTPEDEETAVVQSGRRIAKFHDEIYYEKLEAKRKFEELQKNEAAAKKNEANVSRPGKKPDDIPSQSASKKNLYPQLPPYQEIEKTQPSPPAVQLKRDPSLGSLSSGSDSLQDKRSSFQEKMEYIAYQKLIKQMQVDGADAVQLFKAAENAGYEFDVTEIALEICNWNHLLVLNWLHTNWEHMVAQVIKNVQLAVDNLDVNDVGVMSEDEAAMALKEMRGNVEEATGKCLQWRKTLYADVNSDQMYAREEVLDAMFREKGNKEKVVHYLQVLKITQFVDRVWNGALESIDFTDKILNTSCNSVPTSIIHHREFQDRIKDKTIDLERRTRMILVEGNLQSWGRAQTVLKILDNDLENMDREIEIQLEDIIEAVRNCQDRRNSLLYLQRECQLCFSKFPMSKIRSLTFCQCEMCVECFKQYFAVVIREKNVRNWNCPICENPDMEDQSTASDYIAFLGLLLKNLEDQEVLDLFETKIRDWHLQKDPNFRWCAHCGNGFVYQGWQNGHGRLDMTCPHCRKKTCFECKKQWVDQHTGLTCQQYEQWTIDNDPKNQALGLAKHLEESGIDCPSCKMRYSLAKGGCMHFKCPQCAYDFCSGCNQQFSKTVCKGFKSCKSSGLHCHHPRDCFYYLRDNDVNELQILLKIGKVDFNTATPEGQQDREHCPVMEQKEGAYGHKDEACGREVPQNHAGLCVNHYKEYLVGLINKNKLDPVYIMAIDELNTLLDRTNVKAARPKKERNETDEAFLKKYREFVKIKIPLERH